MTTQAPLPRPLTHSLSEAEMGNDEWRRELTRALVVSQIAPLLAAERHPVRRARLVARAAASLGAGRAAGLARVVAKGALTPLAVLDVDSAPLAPFVAGASGITTLPEAEMIHTGEGIVGTVAATGVAILVPDLAADSRYSPRFAATDARLLGMEPHALVGLPLLDSAAVLGVLAVAQDERGAGFDARSLDLLRAVAAQASLALAVAARESVVEQSRLRLASVQDDERHRLARDLHDGPVQAVANAVMSLEYIDHLLDQQPAQAREEMRRLGERMERAMRELRGVLFDLRPLALESEGLAVALGDLVERHREPGGPEVRLVADLPSALPPEVERTVYLVVREALTNVIKHARATRCLIEVRRAGDRVTVSVRDDGAGFDADAVLAAYPAGQSWGLLSMFERTRALTDRFAIRSRPGAGTEIALEIPLPATP